jgi:hypothetical protein
LQVELRDDLAAVGLVGVDEDQHYVESRSAKLLQELGVSGPCHR